MNLLKIIAHFCPILTKFLLSLFRNCFFASIWMIFERNMIKQQWKCLKSSIKSCSVSLNPKSSRFWASKDLQPFFGTEEVCIFQLIVIWAKIWALCNSFHYQNVYVTSILECKNNLWPVFFIFYFSYQKLTCVKKQIDKIKSFHLNTFNNTQKVDRKVFLILKYS